MSYTRLGHAQLGQTTGNNLLSTVLGSSNAKLLIRSKVTPDITIDLAQLASGRPPQQAVEGQGGLFLHFIRPEIIVSALGQTQSIAPYGQPTENFSLVIAATALGLIAVGAASAFWICRHI